MKKIKSLNLNLKLLITLILVFLFIQLFVTYFLTNTKEFSYRALIRNQSIAISIYLTIVYKNYLFLLIPFILEMIIEFLKFKGFYIEKYIATKYQYNDYWREINKNNPIFSNFSEGNYDNIIGFDTKDHSERNIINILNWCKNTYNNSLMYKSPYLVDLYGKYHDGEQLKKQTDDNKFKLICEICKIKKGMKVLEIGFGEGDFMLYLRNHYNIDPIGVSISSEQVELVRSRGFTAYCMNSWDMTKDVLGTYDLILQCGNLEYIKCTGDSNNIYEKFSEIIYQLLKPNGKYFITCIHFNEKFEKYTFYDNMMCYLLWSGNDGCYPKGKYGFSKYANNVGLKTIHQEDRTNDYFITTVIFMSYLQCMRDNKCFNSKSFTGILEALVKTIAGPYYLHTYLCYSPTNNFYWLPWQWEFIPQQDKTTFNWITPVTLQYILFQK
jgi:cyclopropane fatty-acyl-phospholipid synthase-like methyltransferase